MELFVPFIHDGFLSVNSYLSSSVPVKILMGTGVAQTFIVENTLTFSLQEAHVY